MSERMFRCDMCGTELPRHGERYILRVERVPAFREAGRGPFDLCPDCATALRARLESNREEEAHG